MTDLFDTFSPSVQDAILKAAQHLGLQVPGSASAPGTKASESPSLLPTPTAAPNPTASAMMDHLGDVGRPKPPAPPPLSANAQMAVSRILQHFGGGGQSPEGQYRISPMPDLFPGAVPLGGGRDDSGASPLGAGRGDSRAIPLGGIPSGTPTFLGQNPPTPTAGVLPYAARSFAGGGLRQTAPSTEAPPPAVQSVPPYQVLWNNLNQRLGTLNTQQQQDLKDWLKSSATEFTDPKTGKPYKLPEATTINRVIGGKHTLGDIATLIVGLIAAASGRNGQQFAGGLLQGFLGGKQKLADQRTAQDQQQFAYDQQARSAKAVQLMKMVGMDDQQISQTMNMMSHVETAMGQDEYRKEQQRLQRDKLEVSDKNKTIEDINKFADSGNVEALSKAVASWNKAHPDDVFDPAQVRSMIQSGKSNQTMVKNLIAGATNRQSTPASKQAYLAKMREQFPDQVTPELEKAAAEMPPDIALKQQRYDFLKQFNPERIRNLQQSTLARIASIGVSNERKKLIALEVANFDPKMQAQLANIYSEIATRGDTSLKNLKTAFGANEQRIRELDGRQSNIYAEPLSPDEKTELEQLRKTQSDLGAKINAKGTEAPKQARPTGQTQVYQGYIYTMGADGKWHKGKKAG